MSVGKKRKRRSRRAIGEISWKWGLRKVRRRKNLAEIAENPSFREAV